jgi:peptidoglycan/LPS O-acetylase OafA/YrhL
VPYGDQFANFPGFKQGFLGVHLFFMISGFVILMTLDKCKNFFEFITRRWLRLFPAMLVATILIFLTAPLFPERPEGMLRLRDVIPGLTFIQQEWIHTNVLDGSFWSLFVEVKYYFIFGTMYFVFGGEKAIIGLFICFCIWLVAASIVQFSSTPPAFFVVLKNITKQEGLSFNEFSWFACGSLAYLYFTTKNRNYFLFAGITGIIAASTLGLTSSAFSRPAFIVLVFFLAAVYFEGIKKLLANKVLIFIGFISYPLYLLHQNIMIALIAKMGKQFSFIPGILLPVIPILLLVLISYLIAKVIEPTIRKKLNKYLVSPLMKYFQSKDPVVTPQV